MLLVWPGAIRWAQLELFVLVLDSCLLGRTGPRVTLNETARETKPRSGRFAGGETLA
jgi:hypothetical protein